jgi:Na+-driven multidrug efflux pump
LIAPFWVLLTLFPEASLRLVLPDMAFSNEDLWYFRVYMLVLPFLPMVFMSLTYLPAIEQPKYASIVAMARQVVFYVPIMLILPKWIGMSGIYYGATFIDVVLTGWLVYIVWKSFKSFPTKKSKDALQNFKPLKR